MMMFEMFIYLLYFIIIIINNRFIQMLFINLEILIMKMLKYIKYK